MSGQPENREGWIAQVEESHAIMSTRYKMVSGMCEGHDMSNRKTSQSMIETRAERATQLLDRI